MFLTLAPALVESGCDGKVEAEQSILGTRPRRGLLPLV